MQRMDVVVESAVEGVRKPDVRIYELLCERLQVRPNSVVFLDDIGANLKPAAAMGMRTIKVSDPHQALHDLEAVLGFPLKGYVPGTVGMWCANCFARACRMLMNVYGMQRCSPGTS